MATKTVVCPECGSETAPGRYTCSECGAFLEGGVVTPAAAKPSPTQRPARSIESVIPLVASDEPGDTGEDQSALPPAGDLLLDDGLDLDPVDPTIPPPADHRPDVQWPPAGDFGARPAPEPRVPAGTWLPPSAHLTGLEEPAPEMTAGAAGAAAAALPAPGTAATPRDWLAAFGTPERRWAAARRTIAIGSAVAVFGFLLPWGNGSLGNLLNVWLNVWGLAFPGHWLIALGLGALCGVAVLAGRAESWPLGVPAVALASLLAGLIWPLLFGVASRPIGILVVLVGAIVLVVGGILQLGARHEAATPDV